VGDERDLFESGRPQLPRRRRLRALIVSGLAVSALVVVGEWRRSAATHHPAAVAPTSTQVLLPNMPPPTTTPAAWPTAPQACGGDAELPIVSSVPAKQRTGIELLLGGSRLHTVDFDSGRAARLPQVHLRSGEFVVGLLAASQTYAVTGTCATTGAASRSRLVRIGADGSASIATLPGSIGTVFADGPHAWGVTFPDDRGSNAFLVPLDGGSRVRLPTGFGPVAITGGMVVGNLVSTPTGFGSTGPGSLLLVDAATGHVRADLGTGPTVAVGHGVVLWTVGCDPSSDKPCALRRRSVADGATASYRLPRPAGFATGVLSADGQLLAFTLERAAQDPRFEQGHPIPPADIAILHLDTGALDVVPGIEIPAKMSPGLAFSTDGRWLVMALNAGTKTRLLAWRHGLIHPYESTSIAGLVWGPPAIVALPSRPGA
jgi:hypothetical protein